MTAFPDTFYVSGGTLKPDTPSYVSRHADYELLEGLTRGQFCYVLTSRQMGKSSLMVRTAIRLREQGNAVAILDLTEAGANLTVEQWYYGLLRRLGEQIDLLEPLITFWRQNKETGPLTRFMDALRDVALPLLARPLVIFVDEIDFVRSLSFSTDEFFAAIRECYNRRAQDSVYNDLTFCLLGVATPSDLIQDTRTTPFNIGKRIELQDFSPSEAAPLAAGLGSQETGPLLLARVLTWTNGHPYLTQLLCHAIAERPHIHNTRHVDALCADLFFGQRAREQEDNLLFVRERLLKSEVDRAGLLDMYTRIWAGRRVEDAESSPLITILRLSGIVRAEQGWLKVRNRIYHHVFDRRWVQANMPDAEMRRQRAAYRKGLMRAAVISTTIFVLMSGLLAAAVYNYQRANHNAVTLKRQLYPTRMALAYQALVQSKLVHAKGYLDLYAKPASPEEDYRGFDWRYLMRLCQPANVPTLHGHQNGVTAVAYSPDGTQLASIGADNAVCIWNTATGQMTRTMPYKAALHCLLFLPDGHTLVTGTEGSITVWDVRSGQNMGGLAARNAKGHLFAVESLALSPDAKWLACGLHSGRIDLWKMPLTVEKNLDKPALLPFHSLLHDPRGNDKDTFSRYTDWPFLLMAKCWQVDVETLPA